MAKLIQCLLGATEQVVRGNNYAFNKNAKGQFVCLVNDDHDAACFLGLDVYKEVKETPEEPEPAEPVAQPTIVAVALQPVEAKPKKATKADLLLEAQALGIAGINSRVSNEDLIELINARKAQIASNFKDPETATPGKPETSLQENSGEPVAAAPLVEKNEPLDPADPQDQPLTDADKQTGSETAFDPNDED